MRSTHASSSLLTSSVRAVSLGVNLVGGNVVDLVLSSRTFEILLEYFGGGGVPPVGEIFVGKQGNDQQGEN